MPDEFAPDESQSKSEPESPASLESLAALRAEYDRLKAADPTADDADAYIAALEARLGITREPPKIDVTNKYMLASVGIDGDVQFLNRSVYFGRIKATDAPVIAAWLVAMTCGPERFQPILDAVMAT